MKEKKVELVTIEETAERLSLKKKEVMAYVDEGTFLTNNLPGDALRIRWIQHEGYWDGPDQPKKLLRLGRESRERLAIGQQPCCNFGMGNIRRAKCKGKK